MALEPGAPWAEKPVLEQRKFAVAEMQAWRREAGLDREQAGHGEAAPRPVGQAFSQNHEPTAFAENHRSAFFRGAQATEERRARREPFGVKLRIPAW